MGLFLILYDVLISLIGPTIYGLFYFSLVGKPKDVPDCWTVEGRERGFTEQEARKVQVEVATRGEVDVK